MLTLTPPLDIDESACSTRSPSRSRERAARPVSDPLRAERRDCTPRVRGPHPRASRSGRAPPEAFDALAVDLARFQAAHVAGYARLCAARGVDPARSARAADAPAVPTDAFKLARVFAFDAAEAAVTFRTSGTTVGARGAHPMRDGLTYDAAALAFGRVDARARHRVRPQSVLILGPSPREAPDSSLSHMCALFARSLRRGRPPRPTKRPTSFARRARPRRLSVARVNALRESAPALVLATSFASRAPARRDGRRGARAPAGQPRHADRRLQGQVAGGRAGRAAMRRRARVRGRRARRRRRVRNDGAVEPVLGGTLRSTRQHAPASFASPPGRASSPSTPCHSSRSREGAVGIARIEDLANVDSAFAVVTQDRVRRAAGGFELLGRARGAPPRGCSIAHRRDARSR